jgi:phosphopantothenate-cysteine ligase
MAPTATAPAHDLDMSFLSEILDQELRILKKSIDSFVVNHSSSNRPIALVSSGGTVCDLEVNSVRCLDNFSTGLRGATCVEEFLKRGYAVVHLWRAGSASPFARVLSQVLSGSPANHALDVDSMGRLFATDLDQEEEYVKAVLQQDPFLSDPAANSEVTCSQHPAREEIGLHRSIKHNNRIQRALSERATVLSDQRLLTIPFRTVEEYLGRLQLISTSLNDCPITMCFLAAAVSDFYIPQAQRTEHKIQSANDGLTIHLEPVPKAIGQLRRNWAPEAFVVSFKLETDPQILREKSERAVSRYGCHMVIGNLLKSRHEKIWLLQPPDQRNKHPSDASDASDWPLTEITRPVSDDPDALESKLVDTVVQAHFEYISWHFHIGGSGIKAAMEAQARLKERKRRVHRAAMVEKVKGLCTEATGVILALVLSYSINSILQRRLRGG